MLKAELVADTSRLILLEILKSGISPRKRKSSSSNRWGEHHVRGTVKCLVQIIMFLRVSVLSDVHFWSDSMWKNANDSVAVNKNMSVQIVPDKQRASLQWSRMLLMPNKLTLLKENSTCQWRCTIHTKPRSMQICEKVWFFTDEVLLPRTCGNSVLCYFKHFCTISRIIHILSFYHFLHYITAKTVIYY